MKNIILFVCTNEENKKIALENGADLIIDKDILEDIKMGTIKFNKLYSTTEGLNLLKPFAKILGPLGLFPNPKVDTLFPAKDTGRPDLTSHYHPQGQERKSRVPL